MINITILQYIYHNEKKMFSNYDARDFNDIIMDTKALYTNMFIQKFYITTKAKMDHVKSESRTCLV